MHSRESGGQSGESEMLGADTKARAHNQRPMSLTPRKTMDSGYESIISASGRPRPHSPDDYTESTRQSFLDAHRHPFQSNKRDQGGVTRSPYFRHEETVVQGTESSRSPDNAREEPIGQDGRNRGSPYYSHTDEKLVQGKKTRTLSPPLSRGT